MLLKTITFDETAVHWTNNRDFNMMFLRIVERYLNEHVRNVGYVYLNEICEKLGVAWNPKDENPCVVNDGVDRITFIQFETSDLPNNSFLVHIHSYD